MCFESQLAVSEIIRSFTGIQPTILVFEGNNAFKLYRMLNPSYYCPEPCDMPVVWRKGLGNVGHHKRMRSYKSTLFTP